MHTPAEIEGRYVEAISELKRITSYSHTISSSLAGQIAPGEREFYASTIFAKATMHAMSVLRNAPSGLVEENEFGNAVWDVSSLCAMVRALIESFDALAYIAVHPVSDASRSLRIKIWELHDLERRHTMLRLIGSKSPHVAQLEQQAEELRTRILQDPALESAHSSVRAKINKGECPDFLQTLEQRNQASEISHGYYLGARMFLSSYVHTHPFSVHQLAHFRAGDPNSLNLISIAIRYAVVFQAKSIGGIRHVFGGSVPRADGATDRVINIWSAIAREGVQHAG